MHCANITFPAKIFSFIVNNLFKYIHEKNTNIKYNEYKINYVK